jgi:hypothetical protein
LKAYIFHEGILPPNVSLDYQPSLFNLPEFTTLHDVSGLLSFYLLDQKKEKAIAGIHFHLKDHLARSPYKAPFGSVECTADINAKLLYQFLEYVELRLKEKGAREVYIKNPPHGYDPRRSSLLETFLLNEKYSISQAELSAIIPVQQESFRTLIAHSEKLRLRQAKEAGFSFEELPAEAIAVAYNFISQCHKEKKYEVSIALKDLQKAAKALEGRYLVFVVRQEQNIVAAAISIAVNSGTLYNFLTNHDKEFNALSPSVLLMEGIYNYCRQHQFKLFDLGTSALHGKPNFKLLDFKLHLGGIATSKFSFYKKIG